MQPLQGVQTPLLHVEVAAHCRHADPALPQWVPEGLKHWPLLQQPLEQVLALQLAAPPPEPPAAPPPTPPPVAPPAPPP